MLGNLAGGQHKGFLQRCTEPNTSSRNHECTGNIKAKLDTAVKSMKYIFEFQW